MIRHQPETDTLLRNMTCVWPPIGKFICYSARTVIAQFLSVTSTDTNAPRAFANVYCVIIVIHENGLPS